MVQRDTDGVVDPVVMVGAEAGSWTGGPDGVLVLHGFTGHPGSIRPLAEAVAGGGFTVEAPRLPGHGTSIEDMCETGWNDWLAAADEAYADLAARCDRVVIMGLSMGGALTLFLAARHPEAAGIVCINAPVRTVDGMREFVEAVLADGIEVTDGLGSDIADPEVVETAYVQTPLRPLLTMIDASENRPFEFEELRMPALVITSRQDHVVTPADSEYLVEHYGGPVEHVWLERSFHVATLDLEHVEVERRCVAFAKRVCEGR